MRISERHEVYLLPFSAFIDVDIDHGGFDFLVTEQLLQHLQFATPVEEPGSKSMPGPVERNIGVEAEFAGDDLDGTVHGLLDHGGNQLILFGWDQEQGFAVKRNPDHFDHFAGSFDRAEDEDVAFHLAPGHSHEVGNAEAGIAGEEESPERYALIVGAGIVDVMITEYDKLLLVKKIQSAGGSGHFESLERILGQEFCPLGEQAIGAQLLEFLPNGVDGLDFCVIKQPGFVIVEELLRKLIEGEFGAIRFEGFETGLIRDIGGLPDFPFGKAVVHLALPIGYKILSAGFVGQFLMEQRHA